MTHLTGKTVAFLATNGFEDSELTSPWQAVTEHGATAVLVSTEAGTITGKNGHEAQVDRTTSDAAAGDFDALVLPGGVANGDKIRLDEAAVAFVKGVFDAHKPVGVICHGGWILTDADVLRGRTLTSYPSLKTDLRNAGATWVDQEVVVDAGLVSSRVPDDLPAFNAKLVEEIAEGEHTGRKAG
ncbi:type 1 glutamine amidotransferase domain-containing protein [Actinotalea subterranea]|uniref:type 1 glutamine amidotransferase domain-containing protein n=1 Tax=Actinotalea subterranea TaxID=2607497 RepID=UPI0011EC146A|nr:type 1 glutamine amidotransferase domain-containing protein [Actinotalea subterranea]